MKKVFELASNFVGFFILRKIDLGPNIENNNLELQKTSMPRAAPWQLDTPCSLHLLSTKQSLKTSSRFVGLFKALKKTQPILVGTKYYSTAFANQIAC